MKPFIPSSDALTAMIRSAEARFDGDRDQALRRREARADDRMARVLTAQAEALRRRRLYGID